MEKFSNMKLQDTSLFDAYCSELMSFLGSWLILSHSISLSMAAGDIIIKSMVVLRPSQGNLRQVFRLFSLM